MKVGTREIGRYVNMRERAKLTKKDVVIIIFGITVIISAIVYCKVMM